MKWPIKKIGAAVLSAALLASYCITGCSFKKGKEEIVDESGLVLSGKMPDTLPEGLSWYDYKEDSAIFDYLKDKIGGYFVSDITWFNGRMWLFVSETEPDLPVYHIMSFDENNKETSDFVIRNEFGDNISLNRMISGNRLYLTAFDFSRQSDYLYPVDENTGSVSPDDKIDISGVTGADDSFKTFAFSGNDLAVLKISDTSSAELIDISAGASKKKVSLDQLTRDYSIRYPEGIMGAGNNKAVVWGGTSSNMYFGQIRYCLIDFETGNISALDEMEYINVPLRNLTYCDGKLVTVTDGGVYLIDTDSSTCKMTLSFNCSNCNRFLVNNSELKYADDSKLIFSSSRSDVTTLDIRYSVCSFTVTSDYPAAGKEILTVASTEDLDYSISKAIMRFNSESSSSFILFDSRYKANGDIDYSNADSAEASALNTHRSYALVSDRLAMDIMSGKGPDIIISNGANEQLSKSDYFLDLTDYLEKESGIDESSYFMNAINASRFNGGLYQFPIGFSVEGLIASSDCFGGRNGLTFDEYLSMVKTVCNGQDPVYDHQLYYSRTEIAARLFAYSNELFIKDGKADLNNDAFRAILDYCKTLPVKGYFEGKDIDAEFEDLIRAQESMPVQPVRVYGFYEYETFAQNHKGDIAICGYPSSDGRTATIVPDLSVSVSAHSSNTDACKEFLGILLSDEIQSTLGTCIPMNRKCAKDLALNEIESNNEMAERYADRKYASVGEILDPALADRYIEQISKASTSGIVYHSISLIIYEEIPAYFEDQKSFEDVANTINDRAQKVLDERK